MILDFGNFTRRGFLVDLECSEEIYGGQGREGKAGEEMEEDRKTTDLPVVRECETQRISFIAGGNTYDLKCLSFHSVKSS